MFRTSPGGTVRNKHRVNLKILMLIVLLVSSVITVSLAVITGQLKVPTQPASTRDVSLTYRVARKVDASELVLYLNSTDVKTKGQTTGHNDEGISDDVDRRIYDKESNAATDLSNHNLVETTDGAEDRLIPRSDVISWKHNESCNGCFPHEFNYLIRNDHICNTDSPIAVMILITTAHAHTDARQAIRQTWLTISGNNTSSVRYVFMLGKPPRNVSNDAIRHENDLYHDILQEDFEDSYYNLTYKTIMGYKWVSTMCPNARYVMKADDDVFLNVPNLLKMCQSEAHPMDSLVIGQCARRPRPIRNQTSKWYLSVETFPDTFFPSYCNGPGYITSFNVARAVYEISQDVPFFRFEDVYVGFCLKRLGIGVRPVSGFGISGDKYRYHECFYKGDRVLSVHNVSPLGLRKIWDHPCTPLSYKGNKDVNIHGKLGERIVGGRTRYIASSRNRRQTNQLDVHRNIRMQVGHR